MHESRLNYQFLSTKYVLMSEISSEWITTWQSRQYPSVSQLLLLSFSIIIFPHFTASFEKKTKKHFLFFYLQLFLLHQQILFFVGECALLNHCSLIFYRILYSFQLLRFHFFCSHLLLTWIHFIFSVFFSPCFFFHCYYYYNSCIYYPIYYFCFYVLFLYLEIICALFFA